MDTAHVSRNPSLGGKWLRGLALLLVAGVALAVIGVIIKQSEGGGSPLSDSQIKAFLRDDADPGGIGFALKELQTRVRQGQRLDAWVPELMRLSSYPAETVRHQVAVLMAQDVSRPEFQRALREMLGPETPLVRNTVALALASLGDPSGHEQIATMLQPTYISVPRPGHVEVAAPAGTAVEAGSTIVRVHTSDAVLTVLSPVAGKVRALNVQDGESVPGGTWIAVVEPGPDEILAALRALQKVGRPQDLPALSAIENSEQSEAVRAEARLTAEKLRQWVQ